MCFYQKTDLDKIDIDMENSSENDSENLKYKSARGSKPDKDSKSLKASNKLNKLETEPDDSPSMIKTKKCVDMEPPVSSQIQMTIWKEDNASQMPAPSRSSKSRQSKAEASKKDAIAERIISASRASSSSKR